MKQLLFLVIGCLIGCVSCHPNPPAESPEISPNPRYYRAFTTPGGQSDFHTGDLQSINTRYCLLFDQITDSSEIWMAMYEFTFPGVILRLLHNLREHPGAKARLLFDPQKFHSPYPDFRGPLLDSLRLFAQNHPAQLVLENDQTPNAGIFSLGEDTSRTIMHAKFLLLTHLDPFEGDSSKSILAISTANIAYGEAGESNEMVFLPDHPRLNAAIIQYFNALVSSKTLPEQVEVEEEGVKLWFFPRKDAVDPVHEILMDLADCARNRPKGSPDPMRIRVAMSHWDHYRMELADQLIYLKDSHNVEVKVILREDTDVEEEIYTRLQRLGKGNVRVVPSRTPEAHYGVHSKLMLAEYPAATGMEYRSWLGSHNWNRMSLTQNSEVLAEVPDFEVYFNLFQHWKELWNAGVDSTYIYKK